jgi:hypothetical protein
MINHQNEIDNRICGSCKESKPLNANFFYKNLKHKSGFDTSCKKCIIAKSKKYQSKKGEVFLAKRRLNRTGNAELKVFKLNPITNTKICSSCREEKNKDNFYLDKETKMPSGKCFQCRQIIYQEKKKNLDFVEKEKVRLRILRKKNNSTPHGRIESRMANAIWYALKRNKQFKQWVDLVGYTTQDLKNHIQNLFTEGMTWDLFLQGKIHIDHRIPKSWFNYTSYEDEEFKKCWALENLQPKWAEDNLRKNASYAD